MKEILSSVFPWIWLETIRTKTPCADADAETGNAGCRGGEIVFAGTPREMVEQAHTITAEYQRKPLNDVK